MSQFQDVPYTQIKETGRKYEIYILHIVDGYSIKYLAQHYGVSASTITHDYYTVLRMIMRYYINHLTIIYGYSTHAYFSDLWSDVEQCYCERQYAVTYFEKEYSEILEKYRAGEPGVPTTLSKILPPYRKKFSAQTIASVVRLREVHKMTFASIGKRLRMTYEKAFELYNHHYFLKFDELAKKIMDSTGEEDIKDTYYSRHKIGFGKLIYDDLVSDYPEFAKCKER